MCETSLENPNSHFSHSSTPPLSGLKRQSKHDTFIKAISSQDINWPSIMSSAQKILCATTPDMERIKFLFETNIHNNFISFIEHFAPLLPEISTEIDTNIYESGRVYESHDETQELQDDATKLGGESEDGYRISEIAEIVSQPYFHGFISATDAKVLLDPASKGSFIIRFSSNKKFYCLDVKDDNQVRHWRIERLGKHKLSLPGKVFNNFVEIIVFYQSEPLQLQNGSPCCCLSTWLPKKK
eukprot:TRINITY_DN6372_c0_g1_i1.p1 TRINITY_DN6372_c0_g1~~TRINITY_DN6372_c0_g1_i1.p1  ORF type:complete len:241 (-),score=52.89 TRINITY_DN6372_c0_g1_i1:336-1058(-)